MTVATNYGSLGATHDGVVGANVAIGIADNPITTEASGKCFEFPGTGNRTTNAVVAATDNTYLDAATAYTISIWIKDNALLATNPYYWSDYEDPSGHNHYSLYRPGGTRNVGHDTDTSSMNFGGVGYQMDSGVWRHIFGIYDAANSQRRIFISDNSGVMQAGTSGGFPASLPTLGNSKARVGAAAFYDVNLLTGRAASAAVWGGYAMSLAEAQLLHDKATGAGGASGYYAAIESGFGSVPAAHIHWRMNESAGGPVLQSAAGATSPAGALSATVARILTESGVVTPAGAVQAIVSRLQESSGSMAPAGNLTALFIPAPSGAAPTIGISGSGAMPFGSFSRW